MSEVLHRESGRQWGGGGGGSERERGKGETQRQREVGGEARERERERERWGGRQTDGQTETETDRQKDRQTDRQTDRETQRHRQQCMDIKLVRAAWHLPMLILLFKERLVIGEKKLTCNKAMAVCVCQYWLKCR